LLDSPVRKNIVNLLFSLGSASFKSLSTKLELDRAGLAYHIRLLKNAGLIDNFYSNRENTRSYSYYRLTEFARWLLTHDVTMTLESQQYLQQVLDKEGKEEGPRDKKEQMSKKISAKKKGSFTDSFGTDPEQVKIKKDPRVRYHNYKIYLK
jgi:predicted transcriptional regulator